MTVILTLLFLAAAATSNWAVSNLGHDNGPAAPHTIPIGWGLEAPSGVVLIGLMLAVRDALHERVGLRGTLVVILAAGAVSATVAPASLALASAVTLLVAESADALVYQRLQRQGRLLAAAVSNVVSSLIDSAVFLSIAFGSLAALHGTWGLTLGKIEASFAALAVITLGRYIHRDGTAVRPG